MDRFTPVAPAVIRVQVLPAAQIERGRFKEVLEACISSASVLRLNDLDGDEQTLLSPKKFPQGSLLFSYTTGIASQQEQQLSPFELFREPHIVLGVVGGPLGEDGEKELRKATEHLREQFPRVIHRHLLILPEARIASEGDNITRVAKSGDDEVGQALRDALGEIASRFLRDFSTYAQATQASPTIQTPGQASRKQRPLSLRSDEGRPRSGSGTPTAPIEVSSPVDDASRPPSRNVRSPPLPPTSFDMIRGANTAPTALQRSDSQASKKDKSEARADSQERGSVHGLEHGLSQRKIKERGKARVGIVLGHIHMMAGNWADALRILADHTSVARKLSDGLWHAKGLEGIVVCMLLLAWAGLDFQIPSICYSTGEKSGHGHRAKMSVNLSSEFWSPDAAHQASMRRLSASLPDLLKQVLDLFAAGEGSLELPTLVLSEIRIRFCNLLAVLYHSKGELSKSIMTAVMEDGVGSLKKKPLGSGPMNTLSSMDIASIAFQAIPEDEDALPAPDRIQILTGVYGVLEALEMKRKSGMILHRALVQLTSALNQARKAGAAEAGIHPAASLSLDTTGFGSLMASTREGGGVDGLIGRLAHIFGVNLLSPAVCDLSDSAVHTSTQLLSFGNSTLKAELLSAMIAFFEASPDPQGVLHATAALLRAATPFAALDSDYHPPVIALEAGEQIRAATTISRTVGVSKYLGLADVQAEYWDAFLVRDLRFTTRDVAHTLIPQAQLRPIINNGDQNAPSNPLLYDPNASRAGTATKSREVIARNEPRQCYLVLQNPLAAPVEVESLKAVTDDEGQLECMDFQPVTLQPSALQQVVFSVLPTTVGDFDIKGFAIKIASCAEEFFPIVTEPWAGTAEQLVKYQGQDAQTAARAGKKLIRAVVSVTAIEPMAYLEVAHLSAPDSSVMLLEGEEQPLQIAVRNTSDVTATVLSLVETRGAVVMKRDGLRSGDAEKAVEGLVDVEPGAVVVLDCRVFGKVDVAYAKVDILYCALNSGARTEYARVLSVPLSISIDPVLQLRHPEVVEVDRKVFELSFDVCSAWPSPIRYRCDVRRAEDGAHPQRVDVDGVLSFGEAKRVVLRVERRRAGAGDALEDVNVLAGLRSIVTVRWLLSAGEGRFGVADIGSLALSKGQLEIIQGCAVRLEIETPASEVHAGSFVTVRVRVVNGSNKESTISLLTLTSPHDERRVVAAGTPQVVQPISAGAEKVMEFTMCPLLAGNITLRAVLRPVGSEHAARLAASLTEWSTMTVV